MKTAWEEGNSLINKENNMEEIVITPEAEPVVEVPVVEVPAEVPTEPLAPSVPEGTVVVADGGTYHV